mgnify:CR=1 FL=1
MTGCDRIFTFHCVRKSVKDRRPAPRRRLRKNGKPATPRPSVVLPSHVKWWVGKGTLVTPVEFVPGERNFTTIENVASFQHPIGAVAVMERAKGTTAAEHYHLREGHTVHIVKGGAIYRQRPVGSTDTPLEVTVLAGQAVFSPPHMEHAFYFTEDTIAVVVANISRTKEAYESDVRRLSEERELFKGTFEI